VQELALEAAGVEVEDRAGLDREVGIGGKDPGAVKPGRIASCASQRTIVECEASQMPRSTTSR